MAGMDLEGIRVLIVEDNYVLASATALMLESEGAVVADMCGTSRKAIAYLASPDANVDVVLLDVNLGDEVSYPVADVLTARRIPFLLATGYDKASIDARFAHARVCQKPFNFPSLVAEIRAAAVRSDS